MPKKETHWLYRMYDAEDTLLYVGLSRYPFDRFYQHSLTKSWFDNVRRITCEWFKDGYDGLASERKAIVSEKPLINKNHNGGHKAGAQPIAPETAIAAPQSVPTAAKVFNPIPVNWWRSEAGILDAGRQLNLPAHRGEGWASYVERLRDQLSRR